MHRSFKNRFRLSLTAKLVISLGGNYTTKYKGKMRFSLSIKEEEKADDFIKNHKCNQENNEEHIITYCFKPLGLGTMVAIRCDCKKERILNVF